jgi:hypothetical protein
VPIELPFDARASTRVRPPDRSCPLSRLTGSLSGCGRLKCGTSAMSQLDLPPEALTGRTRELGFLQRFAGETAVSGAP